jgi:uridine kinase
MTGHPDPSEIVATVDAAPARLHTTRLLCIDGPAGSGKTTLAAAVAEAAADADITTSVVHMDDLYEGWSGLDKGVEPRLLAQLIEPLATGQPARWQRYNWYEARFDDWVDQPPVDLLILEGCGSGARAYAPYRSVLVWLEAEPETRIARGRARAGEQVMEHWLAWMDSEQRHFAANGTKEQADLHYNTD